MHKTESSLLDTQLAKDKVPVSLGRVSWDARGSFQPFEHQRKDASFQLLEQPSLVML